MQYQKDCPLNMLVICFPDGEGVRAVCVCD